MMFSGKKSFCEMEAQRRHPLNLQLPQSVCRRIESRQKGQGPEGETGDLKSEIW
jgi:hypothetical protein